MIKRHSQCIQVISAFSDQWSLKQAWDSVAVNSLATSASGFLKALTASEQQ